jgi:SAM-dependent methyltransferase
MRECKVCGSSRSINLDEYTTSPWPVLKCEDCDFVFLGAVPDYALLSDELAWEKTSLAERKKRDARWYGQFDSMTRWRMRFGHAIDNARRRRAMDGARRVLEIGCGDGTRIPEGPIPYGIEISAELCTRARPIYLKRGGDVTHAPATEAIERFPEEFFDTILMRSYLEHEAQPRKILERAFCKLAAGGKVLIRVPDYGSVNRKFMGAKWCGFRFPDHVNYFTGKSLRALAESVGYAYRRKNWLSPLDDNIIAELTRS